MIVNPLAKSVMVALSALLLSTGVGQAQISVTGIEGVWTDVQGGSNVNGVGTNEIRWGIPDESQQSGYVFTPAPVVFPVQADVPFDLGVFTHNNFPIRSEGITQATLETDFTFLIDGQEVTASMNYTFLHDETPNTSYFCCDDIVTAVNNNVFSDTFLIGNTEYQVNIKGFRVDGELFTEFETRERKSNSATLVAEINVAEVPIPEPSTYLLLSSMLVFAFFLRRRVLAK